VTTFEATDHQKLRVLVAICSYGERNLQFLKQIIQRYRSMPMHIDVVVLSESPKDLGSSVKVVVGLPSKDPWSLPFAHKRIFAEKMERYDLFIYSEDDIQISESNIAAFLRATPSLAPDEIAGFLLYERDDAGTVWLPGIWAHFHWKPHSVRRRGAYTVAEFTNDHSASYVLTQEQLHRAIASGGFLREPYAGRYDLLCTAATDPYTSCGFRKVICISHLEDFLAHHTPNRYIDISYLSLPLLKEQVQTLLDILAGLHPATVLCEQEREFWNGWWQKPYYERPREALLEIVPHNAKTILSIGSGWGATELRLQQRSVRVTALPLDSVVGAALARRDIEVIYGTWEDCLRTLDGRTFDCVLMTDLLHLQENPRRTLEQCFPFVRRGGCLLLGGPNFDRFPWWIKRTFGRSEFRKLRSFAMSGISLCSPTSLRKILKNAGLQVTGLRWLNHTIHRGRPGGITVDLASLTAREWLLQAQR
jgi:SAM-dependent methyltransferase